MSTSNYIARRYGIRSAMPGFIAKKLCPELTIVPPDFTKYTSISRQLRAILAEYAVIVDVDAFAPEPSDVGSLSATRPSPVPLNEFDSYSESDIRLEPSFVFNSESDNTSDTIDSLTSAQISKPPTAPISSKIPYLCQLSIPSAQGDDKRESSLSFEQPTVDTKVMDSIAAASSTEVVAMATAGLDEVYLDISGHLSLRAHWPASKRTYWPKDHETGKSLVCRWITTIHSMKKGQQICMPKNLYIILRT
ncbi:unnamed protein product [Protopolystoma xenopodis]|uniref:UmuC domain-containing protein n=1 Tax=Protopolystoma xenopodis TaxID=117903 RepID=A0A448WSN2_9PLAT|nr:unnamed protein product [Protopolystoma xenopodis]